MLPLQLISLSHVAFYKSMQKKDALKTESRGVPKQFRNQAATQTVTP